MNINNGLLTLALVFSAAVGTLAGEIELPYQQAVKATAVAIQLDDADIIIACAEDTLPSLEIRRDDPENPIPLPLEINETAAVLSITKSPADKVPLNAVVTLTLPPNVMVKVKGRDLTIQRTCRQTGESPDDGSNFRSSLFDLEGGSVDFEGPGKASFNTINTGISLSTTVGDHTIVSSGGTIDLNGHEGVLSLESTDTTISLRDFEGNLTARLDHSRVSLDDVRGSTEWIASRALLDITGHEGTLQIAGEENDVTIRQSRFQVLGLSGDANSTRLTEGSGTVNATLVGGSLEVQEWVGRLTFQARSNADLEVRDVDGDVVLTLAEDTSCRLGHVSGHTRGSIEFGDLELSNLKSVEISAVASDITAREIRESQVFNLNDGFLTLTTTEPTGKPRLDLKGRARALVEVPTPCRVQLNGPGKNSARVEVQGCDLHRGTNQKSQQRKKRWETRPPISLTVNLDPEAELEVDGILF